MLLLKWLFWSMLWGHSGHPIPHRYHITEMAKNQNTYVQLSYFTVSIFIYLKTWTIQGMPYMPGQAFLYQTIPTGINFNFISFS
jgi:hypothetical protein